MNMYAGVLFVSLSFLLFTSHVQAADYLRECWNRQVRPLQSQLIQFHYQEDQNSLYHSPKPWQVRNTKSTGSIYCNAEKFLQSDTITVGEKFYVSTIQLTPTELLAHYYWSKNLASVTRSMVLDQTFEIARYSPMMLLNYFVQHTPLVDSKSETNVVVYTLTINKTVVKLFIRTTDSLLEKVTTTQHDDILGDITTTLTYRDFTNFKQLYYAQNIQVEKIHGIRDEVTISAIETVGNMPSLIEKPDNYAIEEDKETTPEVQVEKISNHIYFVNFPQAESKATLVEFKDFFVVIDAPLNSANGELIISEAKKIAPRKPVKYYAFGHHHPWYIGGIRPFIHQHTTVLCTKDNLSYLQFIADAPHMLKPDSLYLQPRPLVTELIDSSKTITDGSFEMKIYHIGDKSKHTSDYLLFYFPSEKLILEGDLAWIPQNGMMRKASPTQAALYRAIKELGVDVDTISQSWPIGDKYEVKSVFSLKELEQSVNVE